MSDLQAKIKAPPPTGFWFHYSVAVMEQDSGDFERECIYKKTIPVVLRSEKEALYYPWEWFERLPLWKRLLVAFTVKVRPS